MLVKILPSIFAPMNIKCRIKAPVALFLTTTSCILSFFASGQTDTTVYLIYNARIVDVVKGNIRTENSVLIEKGRIKSIGDHSKLNRNIPSNHLIDAGNRFLIPGLWDMHVHLEGED